jgi:hypothetical protein
MEKTAIFLYKRTKWLTFFEVGQRFYKWAFDQLLLKQKLPYFTLQFRVAPADGQACGDITAQGFIERFKQNERIAF